MAKKSRNKTKKKSKGRQVTVVEETTIVVEVAEEVEASAEDAEEAEVSEPSTEESPVEASEEKSEDSGFSVGAARKQLKKAEKLLEEGNNRDARTLLVELVERGAPLEERENAQELLRQIELDVSTLLVGAVAMLVLVLIPTVGLVKALWALPLLFPILLPLVPGVVGMLSFWVIPFLLPMSTTWHVKFFVPVAGFLLTLILLFIQRSSLPTPGSTNAS